MLFRIGCDNMKIEKINDNQIRCTLTREDLENHQIRISELAYGTEKAKKLFRDMMQQAQIQFGFEADNIPLMIEAIPVSTESIILIITKVEDPEELDTRFSKFAPFRGNDKTDTLQLDGADNIIDIFQKLYEAKMKSTQTKDGKSAQNTGAKENDDTQVPDVNLIRLYEFDTLDDVIAAAHGLNGYFTESIEGAVGGVVGAAALGAIYAAVTHGPGVEYAVICAVGALISMVGDLAASAIKRNRGIKDYGKLIPGHGGILDRFDSVIFTSPIIFYLAKMLLGL